VADHDVSRVAAAHAVIGAGPVGWTTALLLADAGHDVRIITRDGNGPDHRHIDRICADAADPAALEQAAAGAAVLYNAASPPYRRWASDWPPLAASVLSAAETLDAVLVTVSNLYGYGPVDHAMIETDPLAATTTKGRVRAQVWRDALEAHQNGRVRATELRSSDYFGPRVLMSQLGERIIPKLMAGKAVRVLGNPDVPHSWTYITDVARTLTVLGSDERAWGHAWHTPTNPPLSQREMITALSRTANGESVKVRTVGPLAVKALGIFVPDLREVTEIHYQFDASFVVDSTAAQTTFGLEPTPLSEALNETISWYRHRSTTKDHTDEHEHHHSS
jgi:nucleoside-diphosphate-sugar epimerase